MPTLRRHPHISRAQQRARRQSNNLASVFTPRATTAINFIAIVANVPTAKADIRTLDTRSATLPTASLYTLHPEVGAQYLVETDPKFANYRQWLGSDYMLNALSIDPATLTKRLGDGFYEQRLIREQVAQLTGQRFLGDCTSDDAQYRALMDNGITAA